MLSPTGGSYAPNTGEEVDTMQDGIVGLTVIGGAACLAGLLAYIAELRHNLAAAWAQIEAQDHVIAEMDEDLLDAEQANVQLQARLQSASNRAMWQEVLSS